MNVREDRFRVRERPNARRFRGEIFYFFLLLASAALFFYPLPRSRDFLLSGESRARDIYLSLSLSLKKNRFQSSLRVVYGETRRRRLWFPIPRRSEAKQSRANHSHPKGTHVQQGEKVGNRHAHQKSPNVSRGVVTVRDGRKRPGVGEVDQRSDENGRQGGRERGFA